MGRMFHGRQRLRLQTEYYDVFLIDEDFSIERPKRVYRAGLHFVTGHSSIRPHRRKDSTAATIQANGVDTENPMAREMLINQGEGSGNKGLELDERDGDGAAGEEADASHHTFFIVNSQRRLKLVAKNARQMHQVSRFICTFPLSNPSPWCLLRSG